MNSVKVVIASLFITSMTACTWIDVTEQGSKVRVLAKEEVTSCKKVGTTTVKTAPSLAGLERHEYKIREELDTLAKNSAAEIGGDTVVAVGDAVDGRQVYGVYRCIPE